MAVTEAAGAASLPGAAQAQPRARGVRRTVWHGRSVRAQLLITFIVIEVLAALLLGGITILHARKSTRLEIAASLRMAEVLVGETAELLRQERSAEQFLSSLPAQLRHVRHVRITVQDSSGAPVTRPAEADDARAEDRAAAPAWFAALIAPPAQSREVAVLVAGQRVGSVRLIGEPSDEIAEVWENTVDDALVALLVSLAAIAALYLLLGRVLDPLDRLVGGLAELERRNYEVRLERPPAVELAGIADRFNALAAALDRLRGENARLSRRLVTAQDDERRRTALELHDEVGPSLFGLKANATSIAKACGDLQDATSRMVAERARDLMAIVDHLQAINRSMLDRLRPMALGHVPLGDLVGQLVRDYAARHQGVAFSLAAGTLKPGYGDLIDLTVYRCLQEGLTNVVRHAAAAHVEIAVAEAGDTRCLQLAVTDDGRGIDPAAPRGHGLTGMQERLEALAGSCSIMPISPRGTRLSISIPLPSDSGAAA
jgi:two-component system sensor histidine kinase UhpB